MISGEWTVAVSCLFDAILLWLTARFMRMRLCHWRWLGAIVVGQMPTLWVLLRDRVYALGWHLAFLFWPLIMLSLAFGKMKRIEWMRALTIFLASTMLAAGLVLAVTQAAGGAFGVWSERWALALTAGILLALGWWGPSWWRQSDRDQARIGELEIEWNHQVVSVHVLWDSGNLLRDPIGKRPLIIVELSSLWHALPDDLLVWALAVLDGRLDAVADGGGRGAGIVQFDSLGGRGYIPMIRPDRIRTWQAGAGWVTLIPAMVGLVSRPLSPSGRYTALASPDCQPPGDREGVMGE